MALCKASRGVLAVVVALVALASSWVAWRAMFPRDGFLAVGTGCEYTTRVQQGGAWVCPQGTVDTGRSWQDPDGDKQCLVGCAVSPHCEYRGRVEAGKNGWKCPAGFVDSGLTWGVAYGDRQCHKCPSTVDPPGKKCAFTGRQWVATANEWRCPPGSLDTGSKEDWNGCLLACCPTSGFNGKQGGTSELFPCGKWDIERKGGIRRVPDGGVATELYPYCCQRTNKNCNAKLFKGLFQAVKDTGTKGTGFRMEDNGCRVNVWTQTGEGVAVTGKGMGKWGAIGLFAGVGLAAPVLMVAGAPMTALAVATAPLAVAQTSSALQKK